MKYIFYVLIAYTVLMLFGLWADKYIGTKNIPFFKYCASVGDAICDGAHDYNQLRTNP